MRVGISIEKNRVNSVIINAKDLIINSEKTKMQGGLFETVKKNIDELVTLRRSEITHVFIGTDFVRVLLEQESECTPIGVIRLAGHQPDILTPGINWPSSLKNKVLAGIETLDGGYDYDGKPITPMSEQQIFEAARRLVVDKGAEGIVICGVFSTFYSDQELLAGQIVRDNFDVDILECHKLGVMGFMERENAGMLNVVFRKAFSNKLRDIQRAFRELDMSCQLFFSQTNGAILSFETACSFPFLTIDSALVNAFVGGKKLTQYQNCCTVYMDEVASYAMTLHKEIITDHATNDKISSHDFDIPGLYKEDIGLQSAVDIDDYRITIGKPCEPHIAKTVLTLEAAMRICNGFTDFHDKIDVITAYRVIKTAEKMLLSFYKSIGSRGSKGPLVLIGPAAALFPQNETVVVAPFSLFASAYGAAVQGLTCYLSQTVKLTDRQKQLTEMCNKMVQDIYDIKGYAPRILLLEVEAFRYLPEEWAQVTIVATGDVDPPYLDQPETIQELIATERYGIMKKPIYHEITSTC